MELLITLLFIVAIFVILFVIEYWWVLLIFIGMLLLAAIIYFVFRIFELKKIENDVVFAELISREPIIEQVCENTGHTTSYGRHLSYHEHYRNRNVITGYTVKFKVIIKTTKVKLLFAIKIMKFIIN
jgi:ABC-type bacteriocin/lantibiotic exporter with double-glycine peptidase domain